MWLPLFNKNLGKSKVFGKHFLQIQEFEIDFLDLCISGKLSITPFQLIVWNHEKLYFAVSYEFWTLKYFELLSISSYLLYLSYMLYNSKWSKDFPTCSQLVVKKKCKKALSFRTFFNIKVSLWSVATSFSMRPKKILLSIWTLISCNPHKWNFWNFSHVFYNHLTTTSCSCMHPNFFEVLVHVIEIVDFEICLLKT